MYPLQHLPLAIPHMTVLQGVVSWIPQHEGQGSTSCPWSPGLQGTLDVDVVWLAVEQLGCFSGSCSSSFCLAAPAEAAPTPRHFSWLRSCSWRCPEEIFNGLVEPMVELCRAVVVLPESGLLLQGLWRR